MESYGGAGCADCYREHCRQREAPSSVRVSTATASAPDHHRRRQQQQQKQQQQQQSSQRRGGRRFDRARRSCHRLFIAGSFVIGLILVPCAMSAPVKPHQSQQQQQNQQQQNQQQQLQQQQRRHQTDPAMMPTGTPFWHNPCGMQLAAFDGSGGGAGFGSGVGGGGGGHDVMMMDSDAMRREEDIIPSIVMSANQALIHVEQFAGSFVVETFRMDVKPLHNLWKSTTITWLQQFKYMPKELDEPLDSSYLASLTFREVLLATYVGMQNLAVGLEQVAWDQDRERLSFAKDFKETTFKLRAVLCEISAAIYDTTEANGDKSEEVYVSRDIMPLQSRLDNRPLRDWLILREYITGLQYVIEAFEHFKSADR